MTIEEILLNSGLTYAQFELCSQKICAEFNWDKSYRIDLSVATTDTPMTFKVYDKDQILVKEITAQDLLNQ